ncbi:MAG: hypothetical protein JNK23_11330 [Opitutaceae bacterium]|nr:hypothetical protein [Opitutaceae bacterium]
MNLSPEEMTFARDLVKGSRQRIHHVAWVDRDGTHRLTTLNAAEMTQLNRLSGHLGISSAELLRQVAHIPNAKLPPPPAAAPGPAPAPAS